MLSIGFQLNCSACLTLASHIHTYMFWIEREPKRNAIVLRHLPFIYDVVEWILITINIYNHWLFFAFSCSPWPNQRNAFSSFYSSFLSLPGYLARADRDPGRNGSLSVFNWFDRGDEQKESNIHPLNATDRYSFRQENEPERENKKEYIFSRQ